MLFGGFVCAAGVVFLFSYFLSGPKLGRSYDFLLEYKSPVISNEILIIDTEEFIEGIDILSVLMTLTEKQASNLILTGKVSPASSPIAVNDAEIRRRFNDEYNLLSSNVRNLFEGIRMGYVNPVQAPGFVEQVVDLAHAGKDRLISALIDRDEDLLHSVAVFGNFLQADFKPQLDDDGKLRRVNPLENPVYDYLKNRYEFSQIETSDLKQILWLRSHDAKDLDIQLDKNGNIITIGIGSFRRIDINLFRKKDELEKNIHILMEQANELRAFSQVSPDRIPLFLYDYSNIVLDELLKSPTAANRLNWIVSRENFFKSLNDFLNSSAQSDIIGQYEDQISDIDSSNAQQLNNIITRKNNLADIFESLNKTHSELSEINILLKKELESSLCIMGPPVNSDYSALLANAIITGNHIKPVNERYSVFWSVLAVFIIMLIIFLLRPYILLPAGIVLSALSAVIFSGIFIFYSLWIDPFMVLVPSLTGTVIIFICKRVYLDYRAYSLRLAYRSSVSKDILKTIIKNGRPRLTETNTSFAAVIAIKDFNLLGKEDNEKPQDAGKIKRSFCSMAKKIVFNTEAVIAGYEGDTILVCFGSPLDKSQQPVNKACDFVKELIKNEKISWRFGIDAGDCSFSWSPETGFSVTGRPAVRARILVSKTARFKERALISKSVLEKTGKEAEKIGALYDENDTFYAL